MGPKQAMAVVVAAAALAGAASGCGKPAEAGAAEAPGPVRVPVSVANRSGGELSGVGVDVGSAGISFGQIAEGDAESVNLTEALTAPTLGVTWRDAAGQRRFQTLTVGGGQVRSVRVTIDGAQKATLSIN